MKRALKWLDLVGLLLAVAASAVCYPAFGSNKPISDGQQLVPGVETAKDRFVNIFLLDSGPGKVALVDAGMDDSGKALLAALARRGLAREAVSAIFLTHGHGDHTAGCKLFPGADVPRASEITKLAFGHTGPLDGLEPFARFASQKP